MTDGSYVSPALPFSIPGGPMVPAGYCECGCGEEAPLSRANVPSRGIVKGQRLSYVKGHQRRRPFDQMWVEEDHGYASACRIWQGALDKKGYGIAVRLREGERDQQPHRLAWTVAHGPIPEGLWVLHRCDVPCCVRPDHLFLGTNDDNVADMVAKGRQARGVSKPGTKLTDAQIAAIRNATGVLQADLASQFGVAQSYISRLRSGKRRTHLPERSAV